MHATVLHRLCKELTDGSHGGGDRIGHQQPVFTANTTEGKLFIQKRLVGSQEVAFHQKWEGKPGICAKGVAL